MASRLRNAFSVGLTALALSGCSHKEKFPEETIYGSFRGYAAMLTVNESTTSIVITTGDRYAVSSNPFYSVTGVFSNKTEKNEAISYERTGTDLFAKNPLEKYYNEDPLRAAIDTVFIQHTAELRKNDTGIFQIPN